ncbi:transcriptional activator hacA [Paracoccidioides brasiliensis]|uniref:Transcriptional activator hacA n=1 Tax=Paracoccidioides brasiliensis TaxID=121759 RepID=A0A1D2JDI7_PARBR|nr:transcriptional activator hacA [Paracoccidioides brasiliensis]
MTSTPFSSLGSMSPTPAPEPPQLTISPAETTLIFDTSATDKVKTETPKPEEKKPVKKRKSWGQELPTPKTNLPPRKRAKTEDEKEQRRIERVLRNRAAAQTSRERKRLEVEKLEGEKLQMEQQNELLLRRLAQMEAENNRLSQQVAQLSAEIRTSRGSSPQSVSGTDSPTLVPILFKKERDEMSLDKIPFPTPSLSAYSPSLKDLDLTDSSDLTQHPAAMLCDLQCQLEGSLKDPQASLNPSLTRDQAFQVALLSIIQHLFLTMTFTAYSTVIRPMTSIFRSLKQGSPLTFSPAEIQQHLPLILWLISTPTLSTLTASMTTLPPRRPVFRIQLLTRLLACSPALARPLRDATSKALQLVARGESLASSEPESVGAVLPGYSGCQDWKMLLTMIWAIDCIDRSNEEALREDLFMSIVHVIAIVAQNTREQDSVVS